MLINWNKKYPSTVYKNMLSNSSVRAAINIIYRNQKPQVTSALS